MICVQKLSAIIITKCKKDGRKIELVKSPTSEYIIEKL